MICIVMGEYGTKNKSTWFQTWYNPKSSFPLVCTTKKLFRRSTRRSKNKKFYQELCTKKYENSFRRRGNCTYRDSKKNRSDTGHNLYGVPKVINRKSAARNRRIADESTKRILLELQMNLQKEFYCVNQKLNIAITRIAKPYGNPNILAEFIAGQLKNRVSCLKAMKKVIELTEQADTKGIQVQIAGRINGKDIARVTWIREGRVPLQTIRAKIDYCSYTVRTIHGVLGIKIWIFIDGE
uniref:30S ribosomal protein S3, chloroplastic n=1 Tax=Kolkwitzia amabilis TaxID=105268 RepID=A0A142J9I0_KOLAM|nr:ribosomal protein S3 [Kolkwitzia amabilis]AMR73769.1 ribosomal protein S3 [Kolkwitzia amabilis]